MSRQNLVRIIKRLRDEGLEPEDIALEKFRFLPPYQDLGLDELFEKHKVGSEKWHQFVRFIFSDQNERKYITERILRLLITHKGTYDDYFTIRTESGSFTIPDRMSDFVRLGALYEQYFEIYRNIMRRINFDYPAKRFSERYIRGKIDWTETLRKNTSKFPTTFETRNWIREFNTPENILLILCAFWINHDTTLILERNFEEPLEQRERELLVRIMEGSNQIISSFPFKEVIKEAKSLTRDRTSNKISNLEIKTRLRIKNGLIKNTQYHRLIQWLHQYKELNVKIMSTSKTRFPIDTSENLDTLYEIWIFLEFLNYLIFSKNIQARIREKNNETFIEFELEKKKIRFYYEKSFSRGNGTWTIGAKPDFTASVIDEHDPASDEKIVAVFDAKNYSEKKNNKEKSLEFKKLRNELLEKAKAEPEKSEEYQRQAEICGKKVKLYSERAEQDKNDVRESKQSAIRIMLAYLCNLDVNFGALIFPKFDPNSYKYPDEQKSQNPRYHFDLKLEHYRMEPSHSTEAIEKKNQALENIFLTIMNGIHTKWL